MFHIAGWPAGVGVWMETDWEPSCCMWSTISNNYNLQQGPGKQQELSGDLYSIGDFFSKFLTDFPQYMLDIICLPAYINIWIPVQAIRLSKSWNHICVETLISWSFCRTKKSVHLMEVGGFLPFYAHLGPILHMSDFLHWSNFCVSNCVFIAM